MVATNWTVTKHGETLLPTNVDGDGDVVAYGYRRSCEYLRARQAFLNSYQFSVDNTFKETVKRSVKGFREVAMAVVSQNREEIKSRRRSNAIPTAELILGLSATRPCVGASVG
ncbi:unnamed protein product [Ilex paraguariensis]|uniref:Uncharacterized protein n=1 Tax=Ilex paraguariensis TaxID=185542 RepID=A0ABC8TDU9_9AQUA